MKQKNKLTRVIQIWGVILVIGIAVSITAFDIIGSFRDFKLRSQRMRLDYISSREQVIKQEVKRVVDLIYFKKDQSEKLTRMKIKSRVYEAYAIAQHIYQQNKTTKSKPEIQQMILDALRPIRFALGDGYYFATRLDGLEMLFADKPEMEGLNLSGMQDTRGKYVIQDMIDLVQQSSEGFYDYHWTKPNAKGDDFKKISFVKLFEPYGWFIGSGLYVGDVEEQIKTSLLATISRIRFGKEGYIFVNRFNGDALVSNGKLISGTKKLWEVFSKDPEKTKDIFTKEYKAALIPEGDYIYYSLVKMTTPDIESPKVSYIFGIPDLQWLVGAGVYLDIVETDIALMQIELNHQIRTKLLYFSLITLGIIVFFLFIYNRLSLKLDNDIDLLISFFNQAAFSDESIDRDLVQFEEFDRMAVNANKMLKDKIQAQHDLVDEREAFRQSEAKFRDLVESSSDWIWEVNIKGVYTYASPQVESILGYKPEEIVGKTPFDFMLPEEAKRIAPIFEELMEEKEPIVTLENVVLQKNGGHVILETNGVPFFDEAGKVAGYRGVDRDITERKKATQEKEKLADELSLAKRMESLGLMAGGVAHDLNNILSGIVGYPELILRDLPKDSKLRTQIEAIRESGERAATVVADLLTIARGAAGTKEVCNLNSLVREYLDSPEFNKLKVLYPQMIYQYQVDAARPGIFCSPVHVKKCLMNLVTNAAEATVDDGAIMVATDNRYVDDAASMKLNMAAGEYIVLSINDNGPGISNEDLEYIFEPFYTRKIMGKSGTGLGLTVVWNTMEDHDGKVLVESSDEGTSFQLYFPVSTETGIVKIENDEAEELSGNGERILVVDDEPQLRDIASQILQVLGYRVDAVGSGELAIEFVKESPVDLIVIDMLMEPGINGRQTYEEISKLYPNQKAIIVSGFSESSDVKAALKLGAGGFIKKPYSLDQFGRAVKNVLRNGKVSP